MKLCLLERTALAAWLGAVIPWRCVTSNEHSPTSAPEPVSPVAEQTVCTECGEVVPFEARICRFCRTTRLRDVYLARAIKDQRVSYALARDAANSLEAIEFTTAKSALSDVTKPLLRGATPEQVATLQRLFRKHDVLLDLRVARLKSLPLLIGIAAGVAVLALAGLVLALSQDHGDSSADWSGEHLAERVMPQVVALQCGTHLGSGFFVSRSQIVTNHHVTCGDMTLLSVLTHDKRELHARVVKSDVLLDIALLDVIDGLSDEIAVLGDAGGLKVGQTVYTLGSPHGLDFSLGRGVVSHASRFLEGYGFIQTDATVNPGNSGGPLFNTQGEVVGVVSLKRADGIAYALPINYLFDQKGDEFMPPPEFDVTRWERQLDAVEAERREVLGDFDELQGKLVPLQAALRSDKSILLAVGVIGSKPGTRTVEVLFEAQRFGDTLCSVHRTFSRWKPASEQLPPSQSERSRHWLEEQLPDGMFVSTTRITIPRGCLAQEWSRVGQLRLPNSPASEQVVPLERQ